MRGRRRNQSGKLYEIALFVLLLGISAAVGLGQRSWRAALAVLVGLPLAAAAFMGVARVAWGLNRRAQFRRLERELFSADPHARLAALKELEQFGWDAAASAPAVRALLERSDRDERFAAACALAAMGECAGVAVPPLVEALSDESRTWKAAEALGKLGPAARAASPALQVLLRERRNPERGQAAWALHRMRDSAALETLAFALGDPDPNVARWARSALEALAEDADPSVRERAAAALAHASSPG